MDDFGGNEENILRFVFKYSKYSGGDIDEDTIIKEVQTKTMMIRYE